MQLRITLLLLMSLALNTGSYGFELPKLKIPQGIGDALNPKDKKNEQASNNSQNPECVKPVSSAGLNWKTGLTIAAKKALESQLKKANFGNEVSLPEPITNPCEADMRYQFILESSDQWATNLVTAIDKAGAALGIDNEIEAAQLFKQGKSLSDLKGTQISSFRKDLKNVMTEIDKGIGEKKVANKKLLLEADANLRASAIQAAQNLGWISRLSEYASDDKKWLINNIASIKSATDYVRLFGTSGKAIVAVNKSYKAYNKDGVDSKSYKRQLAKAEKEIEKNNKALEKQIKL